MKEGRKEEKKEQEFREAFPTKSQSLTLLSFSNSCIWFCNSLDHEYLLDCKDSETVCGRLVCGETPWQEEGKQPYHRAQQKGHHDG